MTLKPFFERQLGWTKKLTRVATYFAFVAVVLVALLSRIVWAAVEKDVFEIGAGLVALGDVAGPSYRVRLNGEAMNVASATTEQRAAQVLDRFENECRVHTGGLARAFETLPQTLRAQLPENMSGSVGLGIVRKEHAGRGVVACLARDRAGGLAAFAEAIREFSRTGDLSSFGHLRFAFAEQRGDGKTHVVSVWSDGPLRVAAMFPSNGDAPGTDPEISIRPPDSRRILAAKVDGAPFGVHVYDSRAAAQAVLANYDREMPSREWQAMETVNEQLKTGRVFTRAGVDLMVLAEPEDEGGALVSVVAMPPR
jgi:hypothetical protein